MDGHPQRGSTAQATATARAWLLVCSGDDRWNPCGDRAGRGLSVGIRELLLILEFALGLAAFAGLVLLLMLGLSLLTMAAAGV